MVCSSLACLCGLRGFEPSSHLADCSSHGPTVAPAALCFARARCFGNVPPFDRRLMAPHLRMPPREAPERSVAEGCRPADRMTAAPSTKTDRGPRATCSTCLRTRLSSRCPWIESQDRALNGRLAVCGVARLIG